MYGKFIENTAGYEINSLEMKTSWEYIYENKDILLKMDQFGPVYAQANPPGDIMLFKREQHQKYSPWQINILNKTASVSFSNFFKPNGLSLSQKPDNLKICFKPELANYSFEYSGLKCETEFFVPSKGTTIVCKFKVKNVTDYKVDLAIRPHLIPYLNDAIMAPWDKYDWYLDSTFNNEPVPYFKTDLMDADANSSKRKQAFFILSEKNLRAHELSLEKYVGVGDVSHPEYLYSNDKRIYGYPPVYAADYELSLLPGEEETFTQSLGLDYHEVVKYFEIDSYYQHNVDTRRSEFEKLFSVNRIESGCPDFDYYVNYWIPLQMQWVASLDRGWPTGMRGSRDSAQDYAALLYTDTAPCKNIIVTMLECQRSDGWFPRQYSAKGKHGKHDLRTHVDGGAFFIEFIWKYLAHTQDFDILNTKVEWLDNDEKSSVIEHIIKAVDYYITEDNIGEHGLCKIRGGDWLDSVNAAGLKGRGESVTVSQQTVMSLKYLVDILKNIRHNKDISKYLAKADELKEAINKHAFNKSGYYNGSFNDNGKWIFSDNDPDGEKRIYGVSNYYAIISGVADEEKTRSILSNIETLKSDKGYRLFYPYLGKKPIEAVGRVASGDTPPFLAENGNVYNHGSQGFLARALSVAGEGELLYDVLKWLMPYDTEKHPTEKAYTPPYAIVNCWQQLPEFDHRGLMCFLTGSVAMAMRGVYEFMFGIQPTLDGLEISPCLNSAMKSVKVKFNLLNKEYTLKLNNSDIFINDCQITEKRKNIITGKDAYYINYNLLKTL